MTSSIYIISFLTVLAISFELTVPAVCLTLLGTTIAFHTFG